MTMDAKRHLARSRRSCRECSGLSHCATHRKARRILERKGPDAYREFVDETSHCESRAIADSLLDDLSFDADSMLPDSDGDRP